MSPQNLQHSVKILISIEKNLIYRYGKDYYKYAKKIENILRAIYLFYEVYGLNGIFLDLIQLKLDDISFTEKNLDELINRLKLLLNRKYDINCNLEDLMDMNIEDIGLLPLDINSSKNRKKRFRDVGVNSYELSVPILSFPVEVAVLTKTGHFIEYEIPEDRTKEDQDFFHIDVLAKLYGDDLTFPTSLQLILRALRKYEEIPILIDNNHIILILPNRINEIQRQALLVALNNNNNIKIGELGYDDHPMSDDYLSIADYECNTNALTILQREIEKVPSIDLVFSNPQI